MTSQHDVHLRRLREGLDALPGLATHSDRVRSPEFRTWKSRTLQSIQELFGPTHTYASRFTRLQFWVTRVAPRNGGFTWTKDDQSAFERDSHIAAQLLRDAIEEASVVQTTAVEPNPSPPPERAPVQVAPHPTINVTVQTLMTQTTHIELSQVIVNLGKLSLSNLERERAEEAAKELSAEMGGEGRWPMLATSLDKLKSIGKGVYEHVALPLLVEYIKKQSGM